jgi:hypothetical protein
MGGIGRKVGISEALVNARGAGGGRGVGGGRGAGGGVVNTKAAPLGLTQPSSLNVLVAADRSLNVFVAADRSLNVLVAADRSRSSNNVLIVSDA